jgi:hypothetical protein
MRRVVAGAVALTAVVCLSGAGTAQASLPVKPIIENSGMGGVRLGMSRAAVIKHWGKPNDTCKFQPARACSIWQSGSKPRTRHGVPTAFGRFANRKLVNIEFLGTRLETRGGVSLATPARSGRYDLTPFSLVHQIYPSASDLNACDGLGIGTHISEIGGGAAVTAFLGDAFDGAEYRVTGITIYNPKQAGLFYGRRGQLLARGRPKDDPACDPAAS